MNSLGKLIRVGFVLGLVVRATYVVGATLETTVFNPQQKSLFPVSSVLITGPTEAILVDAQFQRNDALSIVELIKKSGKTLTTIYISHGDPDFYFGLEAITAAYPAVRVLAAANTQAYINLIRSNPKHAKAAKVSQSSAALLVKYKRAWESEQRDRIGG